MGTSVRSDTDFLITGREAVMWLSRSGDEAAFGGLGSKKEDMLDLGSSFAPGMPIEEPSSEYLEGTMVRFGVLVDAERFTGNGREMGA